MGALGVILIAIGAILAFAVSVTVDGVDISAVGVVVLVAGVIVLVAALVQGTFLGFRRTSTSTISADDHALIEERRTSRL